jgi:hypothetical protein
MPSRYRYLSLGEPCWLGNVLRTANQTMLSTALAVGAGLVALAFTGLVFERWLWKRRPQDFAWTVSLAMFSLGALALGWGNANGWSSGAFRLYFAFGAILNVPFLASGQLYLLLTRRTADRIFQMLCLFSAFALGLVLSTPFTNALPADRLARGSEVFGPWPRIFAAVASGAGATVVFLGTAIGIAKLLKARRRGEPWATGPQANRRIAGLALLATGTIVLSASGPLNSVLGEMQAFALTLTIGIALLFGGFLLSSS